MHTKREVKNMYTYTQQPTKKKKDINDGKIQQKPRIIQMLDSRHFFYKV